MEIAGRIRQGEYFDVDSSKLYDLPPECVSVGAAASGEQSAGLAAEHGECQGRPPRLHDVAAWLVDDQASRGRFRPAAPVHEPNAL